MSAVQQGTLLEVLKKKMRAMKDELETAKEQAEDAQSRVMDEIRRREEVSGQVCIVQTLRCLGVRVFRIRRPPHGSIYGWGVH